MSEVVLMSLTIPTCTHCSNPLKFHYLSVAGECKLLCDCTLPQDDRERVSITHHLVECVTERSFPGGLRCSVCDREIPEGYPVGERFYGITHNGEELTETVCVYCGDPPSPSNPYLTYNYFLTWGDLSVLDRE
jgi:hypothetical protein